MSAKAADRALRAAPLLRGLKRDYPMARLCTLRAGGPARWLAEPVSMAELMAVLRAAHSDRLPLLVLGGGSNLLVSDAGFPGVVVRLAGAFRRIHLDGRRVEAGAGAPLARVVRRSMENGGGDRIESLFGIPGSVGGAVRMNAGAYGIELSRYLAMVETLRCLGPDAKGELELEPLQMRRDEIVERSGYRQGPLLEADIVTKAILEVKPYRGRASMDDRLRVVLDKRRACQPQDYPSAGSVFKNRGELKAGALIEAAGCKGWNEGPAEVSVRHANFIVNRGGATAGELYRLARRVTARVAEETGVELEMEWRLVGTFDGEGRGEP